MKKKRSDSFPRFSRVDSSERFLANVDSLEWDLTDENASHNEVKSVSYDSLPAVSAQPPRSNTPPAFTLRGWPSLSSRLLLQASRQGATIPSRDIKQTTPKEDVVHREPCSSDTYAAYHVLPDSRPPARRAAEFARDAAENADHREFQFDSYTTMPSYDHVECFELPPTGEEEFIEISIDDASIMKSYIDEGEPLEDEDTERHSSMELPAVSEKKLIKS